MYLPALSLIRPFLLLILLLSTSVLSLPTSTTTKQVTKTVFVTTAATKNAHDKSQPKPAAAKGTPAPIPAVIPVQTPNAKTPPPPKPPKPPKLRRRQAVEVAECGKDSPGKKSCPNNACCSFYGNCGIGDDFCGSPDPVAPCQKDYGRCGKSTVETPSCNGASAKARKVGYYLSYAYERDCDASKPGSMKTAGLTHINFAFALFDGDNFDFYPQREGDEKLYSSFTALKSDKLQTWIAIGGGLFNNPDQPTKSNWATMASTAASRATWIANLIKFMAKYGFQGADLDWEWPCDPTRGGTPADTKNQVLLLKELRAAFGTKYGLSSVLVTDYAALKDMDVKGMEPYVDFFNFMSYDYHTPVDVPKPDAQALSHTNITETDSKLVPLWHAGIKPAKINLGFALYGMTYQMKPTCLEAGCPYVAKGAAGKCSKAAGSLTNLEITRLVAAGGTKSVLLEDALVKQTLYGGNQLVLHDDAETLEMKTAFASKRCLGGTMYWSVDQGL
ncbi:putative chitinase [Morchella snyderi]|nr:putative chitinase [Morchella snyderi]